MGYVRVEWLDWYRLEWDKIQTYLAEYISQDTTFLYDIVSYAAFMYMLFHKQIACKLFHSIPKLLCFGGVCTTQ